MTSEQKIRYKIYQKQYRDKHKIETSEYKKKYALKNKDYLKNIKKEYYQKNKEKIKAQHNKYKKQKYKNDLSFKLKHLLRGRLYLALKGLIKKESALKLLGCDVDFFKKYIESQFQEGMTWENYAHDTWHIDHIKSCYTFDLTKLEEQEKCFHFSNMRPLWSKDNLSRSKKW